MQKRTIGLYVHIPFCAQKCRYCDFLSFAHTDASVREAYTRALIAEIGQQGKVYGNRFLVDSVFLGGGTPSLLSAGQLSRILAALSRSFSRTRDCETTMEANPGALDARKLEAVLTHGVNRLSIGVQSLSDALLRVLGRIHTRADFLANYKAARHAGFANINLDLMFAFPMQALADWRETLTEALDLRPEHVSFYSLQPEEATPLWASLRDGTLAAIDEDTDREMYHDAVRTLTRAGYAHYEISNAARPGFRCRHNLKYWSMEAYLGLGLGAHSYADGIRFSNTCDPDAYIAAADGRAPFRAHTHVNSLEDCISEYMFLGLRRIEGVLEADYARHFGEELDARFGGEIARLTREGLLERADCALRLTPRGIDVSNRVFVAFV
ncbi:MAG: radical SAM family heme chaperone HemW [Clostridiales Family XIII bacterium]|jgi:oxygen-independent coproporphyrinogen-3 oxidase|nr:radical SAM family heme chaperone HemW [Clostridiales Family XIII bacterium]